MKYLPPIKNDRYRLTSKSRFGDKNNHTNDDCNNNRNDGNSHRSILDDHKKSNLQVCSDLNNSNIHLQLTSTANREVEFEDNVYQNDNSGFGPSDGNSISQINTAQNTEPSSNETEETELKIMIHSEFNIESNKKIFFPGLNNGNIFEILPKNDSSLEGTAENLSNANIVSLEKEEENARSQRLEKLKKNEQNINTCVSTNPFDTPPKIIGTTVERINQEFGENHDNDHINHKSNDNNDNVNNNDNNNNNDNADNNDNYNNNNIDRNSINRKSKNVPESNKSNDNNYRKVIIDKSDPSIDFKILNNSISNNKNSKLFESQNPQNMSTLPRHHPMASSYLEFLWKKIFFLFLSSSCVLFFWILQFPQIFYFPFENYENRKSFVSTLSCAFGFLVSASTLAWLIMILNVSGNHLCSCLS